MGICNLIFIIFHSYLRKKRIETTRKYRIAIALMRFEVLKRSVFLNITHTDAMRMKRLCGVIWWKNHAIYSMPNREVIFK